MKTAQKTRVELLAALQQLSLQHPEWRLGQTMANLATAAGRLDAGGLWDLEDEEALAAAKRLLKEVGQSYPTSSPDKAYAAALRCWKSSGMIMPSHET